jgi:hypothetical protein
VHGPARNGTVARGCLLYTHAGFKPWGQQLRLHKKHRQTRRCLVAPNPAMRTRSKALRRRITYTRPSTPDTGQSAHHSHTLSSTRSCSCCPTDKYSPRQATLPATWKQKYWRHCRAGDCPTHNFPFQNTYTATRTSQAGILVHCSCMWPRHIVSKLLMQRVPEPTLRQTPLQGTSEQGPCAQTAHIQHRHV